jgi:hypothetical protein
MKGEDNTSSDSADDMMRRWFEMASQAAEACQKWAANPHSSEAMRQTRSNFFDIWSDFWEHYLRSASFLDKEKTWMAGGLETRKKIHEYLGWLHHEMQLATAPDIDQIMRTMRRLNEDRQEQHEEICRHLNDLSEKLDALGERLSASESKDSPAEPPRADNPGDPHRRKRIPKHKRST